MTPVESPYLTLEEAAIYCRFDQTAPADPVKALRQWLARAHVPTCNRGRRVLVHRGMLDAVLQQADWAVRRRA